MMTATTDRVPPRSVLIVSVDDQIRAEVRASVGRRGYVFDCSVGDLRSVVRSIKVDAVVFIGEWAGPTLTTLREGIASANLPPDQMTLVSTADEARAAVLRALANEPG